MARSSDDVARALPAAASLGEAGDYAAVPALVRVLTDHKDVYARTAAATSLGRLWA